jgi:phage-related protein (TIGR01555 family)
VTESGLENVERADGWSNVVTGLGGSLDPSSYNRPRARRELTQSEIDALYQDDDIAARIVNALPDHATRRWIDVETPGDGEAGKALSDALEDLNAADKFAEWMRRDRKDGGAVMIVGADDGQLPDQELNFDTIKSVRALHVLERWQVTRGIEIERDDTKRWFGEPTNYRINYDAQGQVPGQIVHASRVFALHGVRVSDMVSRQSSGWGQTVLQARAEPLANYRVTWGYVGAAMKRFSETWLSMLGLNDLVSGGKEKVVRERLALLSAMRSSLKIAPIDAGDTAHEMGVQLSGVSEMLVRAMEALAAAAEMPITLLFGTSPGGLSTDNQSGDRNWNNAVAQYQRRTLLRPLNVLIEMLLASRDLGIAKPDRWQVCFRPLAELSESEEANIEKTRAETTAILVASEVIHPMEARNALRSDPESDYKLEDEPIEPADAPAPIAGSLRGGELSAMSAPTAENVQATAFNGAQVSSGLAVVQAVATRQLPRESGIQFLVTFFRMTESDAESIMGATGRTFFVDAQAPMPKV